MEGSARLWVSPGTGTRDAVLALSSATGGPDVCVHRNVSASPLASVLPDASRMTSRAPRTSASGPAFATGGSWHMPACGTTVVNGVLSIPVNAMLSIVQPGAPTAASVPMRKRINTAWPASAVPRLRVTLSKPGNDALAPAKALRPPSGLPDVSVMTPV